ncbi:hypothetical protein Skr01_41520 [Sphaerisporangium krabiense]|uniref:Uncharacterized protein n=1 Tax=Sphaerisporangium krabiense TaxID=763782 RepID=A0A7W9DNV7_9ACTN|nr:hypothetical protein [Sphaerisporangium krabiense]MBB5625419.1 hypothetical protein [Sphaerisporangium krabiense]GII64067.1 hypothetical protein Skr01_41520 [Sphaerisporangium krabiense]
MSEIHRPGDPETTPAKPQARRVRVRRQRVRAADHPLDLRTPSGRTLPY